MVDSLPKLQIGVNATQGAITIAKTNLLDLVEAPTKMLLSIEIIGNDLSNDNNEINVEALANKVYLN